MPTIRTRPARAAAFVCALVAATSAQAATFENADFERGTLEGWTVGGGLWGPGTKAAAITAAAFAPGGARYRPTPVTVSVVGRGSVDPLSGLSTVRWGDHAVRINDVSGDGSVALLQQRVASIDSDLFAFSWAAVLDVAHTSNDAAFFQWRLFDDTAGQLVGSREVHATAAPGAPFTSIDIAGDRRAYTAWIDETLQVTRGHTLTLSILAADCPYGGHASYLYVDAYSADAQPAPVNTVPEAGTGWLAGLGACAATVGLRRRRAAGSD